MPAPAPATDECLQPTRLVPTSRPAYVLVLDTETTGLTPRFAPYWRTHQWEQCRLVQLAWRMHRMDDGTLVKDQTDIVAPGGFVIPVGASNIHGITQDVAEREGRSLCGVLDDLQAAMKLCDVWVAHNVQFDQGVLLSEAHRMGNIDLVERLKNMPHACTMLMGTPPQQRYVKLADLYERCFDAKPTVILHRADADAELCALIYFHLMAAETQ